MHIYIYYSIIYIYNMYMGVYKLSWSLNIFDHLPSEGL